MPTTATIGPKGSHAWQAAHRFMPDSEIKVFSQVHKAAEAFVKNEADFAVLPVYNTREGEIKECFRAMATLSGGFWIDNIVLPIHLSLGSPKGTKKIHTIVATSHVLRQCELYILERFPDATLVAIHDPDSLQEEFAGKTGYGVIEAEDFLKEHGLTIREREVAPYNRSRYAVLGRKIAPASGYDATALITAPLKDRVGLLFDILGEFAKRGVNILDMRTETDIKTQKLRFYFEAEGHVDDPQVGQAIERIEKNAIQEPRTIKILGSFPRVDIRTKRIKSVGFIGTGDMSVWFAKRLENEGYHTVITGRSTARKPEEMIPEVDVVFICVPISATSRAIEQYGPILKDGQALILLAGEAEKTIHTALDHTSPGVEVMLIHNLWGPKAATMKDKNASVVKTARSGVLCSEVEAFLYKHGANICQDTPLRHDLLMGIGQKLPTAVSLAMAMTLRDNGLSTIEIDSHSTLTSIYGILAMARIHSQNPRTYAEILAAQGDGGKIVRDFVMSLQQIIKLAEASDIDGICHLIMEGRKYLTDDFLKKSMQQALAVDESLGKVY